MEHIWTKLMHKIWQNHLLCAFVANLKIGAIYALHLESFCDKNLAIRKVFAFCDSAAMPWFISNIPFRRTIPSSNNWNYSNFSCPFSRLTYMWLTQSQDEVKMWQHFCYTVYTSWRHNLHPTLEIISSIFPKISKISLNSKFFRNLKKKHFSRKFPELGVY